MQRKVVKRNFQKKCPGRALQPSWIANPTSAAKSSNIALLSEDRWQGSDRVIERLPADADVVIVNLFTVMPDQSLGHCGGYTGLVQKGRRGPAQRVKTKRVDLDSAASKIP